MRWSCGPAARCEISVHASRRRTRADIGVIAISLFDTVGDGGNRWRGVVPIAGALLFSVSAHWLMVDASSRIDCSIWSGILPCAMVSFFFSFSTRVGATSCVERLSSEFDTDGLLYFAGNQEIYKVRGCLHEKLLQCQFCGCFVTSSCDLEWSLGLIYLGGSTTRVARFGLILDDP